MRRLEQIDRSIFEHLRRAVVAAGYLPDVRAFTSPEAYTSAKDALRKTIPEHQLIEVFGVGAAESRDIKSVCKITIDRMGFIKGGNGGFPATKYEKTGSGAGATYKKFIYPAASKYVRYELRYIVNLAKFDRIILQIIEDTFGERCYLNAVEENGLSIDFSGQAFLIDQTNFIDASSTDLIERIYTFVVPDVWIAEFKQVGTVIPPLSTVDVTIYYDSTPLGNNTGPSVTLTSTGAAPDFNADFNEDHLI